MSKPTPFLSNIQAKERIEKLKAEINRHRYLYHVRDRQEISDAALDSLKKELEKLEEQFPRFVTSDSPTQRVGGRALKEFKKIRHQAPMLSFNDVFSQEELAAWIERVKKLAPNVLEKGFFAELKIDGLAVSMEYERGIFSRGSTRGDGVVGEDVTLNLKTVEAIPLRLRTRDEAAKDLRTMGFEKLAVRIAQGLSQHIEVRGEVFLGKKEFSAINQEQKRKGLTAYANPRNVAAGSVRQLDPKITALRHLDSFAYDLVTDFGQETHEETHVLLKVLGFKTNPNNQKCDDQKDILLFHEHWGVRRERLPYEIDGIVVIVNDNRAFRRLGVVGKAPRGAIAFKFALKEAETIVQKIHIYVGRTGALTPVAQLRPVGIGGVTVTHATLHNFDQLAKLDVRVGDTVIVGRAGDVIPQITKVFIGLRPKSAKQFTPPKHCPVCNTPVKKEGVFIRCFNKNCPALRRENLYHFASKSAFDITGLGPETVDKLVDAGLVKDIADFFILTQDKIAELEGFAEISAKKLVSAIRMKKQIPLERLIRAFGILHVGEETALVLTKHFGSLEKLSCASEEGLRKISDIGLVVAVSITKWFKNPASRKLLEKLQWVGVKPIASQTSERTQILFGKTIVFTGELMSMTRAHAKQLARELGADISESVSGKTSFVVVGANPGTKYDHAKKLGVTIFSEAQFRRRIGLNQ